MGNPTPRVLSLLITTTSLRGDRVSAAVCESSSGAKWLRIERWAPDGTAHKLDLPIRLAGVIGLALVRYADQMAIASSNARAEAGK